MKLDVHDLHFSYRPEEPVLQGLSFTALPEQVTALIGPNGCGKTTAGKCINRILTPSSGSVQLGDINLRKVSRATIGKYVGYVPQSSEMVPAVSVIEFLLLGRRQLLSWKLQAGDIDAVFAVLERLDIVHLANERFSDLSGGQQQKVLVARAIMQQPELFLFDEPTSALDLRNQLEIMRLVRELAWEEHKTVVIVLHDLSMALNFADHVVLMKAGRVLEAGQPSTVIRPDLVQDVYGVTVTVDNNEIVNPFTASRNV